MVDISISIFTFTVLRKKDCLLIQFSIYRDAFFSFYSVLNWAKICWNRTLNFGHQKFRGPPKSKISNKNMTFEGCRFLGDKKSKVCFYIFFDNSLARIMQQTISEFHKSCGRRQISYKPKKIQLTLETMQTENNLNFHNIL